MKLYAFIDYDLFPYFTHGTISRMSDEGGVELKEYGKGRFYKPEKILPIKEGKKLANLIDTLGKEYYRADKELKDSFKVRLKKIVDIK